MVSHQWVATETPVTQTNIKTNGRLVELLGKVDLLLTQVNRTLRKDKMGEEEEEEESVLLSSEATLTPIRTTTPFPDLPTLEALLFLSLDPPIRFDLL